MLRVGLTGGIGSGKSTVSAMLSDRGAVVVDADLLARRVVDAGTPGLAEVVDAFGDDVLTAGGQLDRAAMARRVFGDDEARRVLEGIIHPRVRDLAADLEAEAGSDAIVVLDHPLLVETGQQGDFDVLVVVDAPESVQLDRLTGQRGMSPDEARARMNAQATREERLAAADVVIDNGGSPDQLSSRVDQAWKHLTSLTGANPSQ